MLQPLFKTTRSGASDEAATSFGVPKRKVHHSTFSSISTGECLQRHLHICLSSEIRVTIFKCRFTLCIVDPP